MSTKRALLVLKPCHERDTNRSRNVTPSHDESRDVTTEQTPHRPVLVKRLYEDLPKEKRGGDLLEPEFAEELLDARLCGMHGRARSFVLHYVDPEWFNADQKARIFAAYDEGVRDRKAGMACLCFACITPLRKFPQAERIAYRSRRYAELTLSGVSDEEAQTLIADELKEGKLL